MITEAALLGQGQLSFQCSDSQNPGTTITKNQGETATQRFSRKNYNQNYYKTNKQRIHEKKKKRSRTNVFQLFSKCNTVESPSMWLFGKLFRWVELLVFVVLSIIMTQYLIRESAVFYLEGHEPLLSAYIKALMVEGTGILFSFSRGKGKLLRISQRVVMVLLCGLTLFSMSCKLFRSAVHDSSSYRLTSQVIRDLEAEQEEKGQLRKTFVNREWIGATRRYDKDLVQVRQRLADARQKLEGMETPDVTMGGLTILIIFRLLVVAANLICIHRVVELFSSEASQKDEILASSRVEFTLNST